VCQVQSASRAHDELTPVTKEIECTKRDNRAKRPKGFAYATMGTIIATMQTKISIPTFL